MRIKLIFFVTVMVCAAQVSFALPAVIEAQPFAAQSDSNVNVPGYLSATVVPSITQKEMSINENALKKIQMLEENIQSLQGQIETLQHSMQQMQLNQAQQFLILNQKIAKKSENNFIAETEQRAPAAAPIKKSTQITPSISAEVQEKATYDAAYSLVSAKAYADAMEALRGYLTIYPEGQFAANATYWLGELNASQKNYAAAIGYFTTVVNRYPQSNKVIDAMLKLGMINKRLDQKSESQAWLTRLIKEYPNSREAHLAQEYTSRA